MAVWGIGAKLGDGTDIKPYCLRNELAIVGYSPKNAPDVFRVLNYIKRGDIIYLKTSYRRTLYIKAIGIVVDNTIKPYSLYGDSNSTVYGMKVKWFIDYPKAQKLFFEKDYHYNVYQNTVYEEYNEDFLKEIISRVVDRL